MHRSKYRGLTLQRELIDRIEEYIKAHPERGYKSLADFVTEAVRKRCEELKVLMPMPELPPLEHFNLCEHGVRILDRTLANKTSGGRIIDVYFKPEGVWCEHCQSSDCYHIKFALKIPHAKEFLSKHGWWIDEEKQEIKRKPYPYY